MSKQLAVGYMTLSFCEPSRERTPNFESRISVSIHQCSAAGLRLQIDNGDGGAAAIFRFGVKFADEGMRGEKFREAAAKCARAVAVNDADAREIFERGGVEEFINAARGFLDGAADDVDFERGRLVGARGMHCDVTLRRCAR